jgi:hypothetical protein
MRGLISKYSISLAVFPQTIGFQKPAFQPNLNLSVRHGTGLPKSCGLKSPEDYLFLPKFPISIIFPSGIFRILFRFLFDEPKAPALWTTLTFWISNISVAVTAWTGYHAIFFMDKNLLVHFSSSTNHRVIDPVSRNLFCTFS